MLKNKHVKITQKDYITFRYFAFLYDYTGIATIIWVSLLSLFVLWDYFMTQRSIIIAVIGVYMIISYINSIFVKLPKTAKEEYQAGTFPNPQFAISLTDSSLSILRENSTPSEIDLTSLYSAFETLKQFCFFISKNNYIILPKNILTDEEIKFVRSVITALPRKNRRNPFSVGIKATVKNIATLAFVTVCAVIIIISYKVT